MEETIQGEHEHSSSLHSPEVKKEIRTRINRLAGQMSAIQRMVEEEAYCVDVLQQISAVQGALKKVASRLLEAHVNHCVYEAMASGDANERRTKIEELMSVFEKSMR